MLADVAGAASLDAGPIVQPRIDNTVYAVVTVTLPTPYPTPAPITETITSTIQTDVFWDIENYQRPISAVQTFFMLPALGKFLEIFMWIAAGVFGLKIVRKIISVANTGGSNDI
jgi:hypothetical protein